MGSRRTLDRAVARSGAGSRSQAQAWIGAGRVRVDGRLVRDPSLWIDPATARITLADEQLDALRRGVVLDDGPTLPAGVRRLPSPDRRARVELILREGRNRQVRRMLRAVVVALERVAIGPLVLGALASGTCRPLTGRELAQLRSALRDPDGPLSPRRQRSR